MWKQMTIESPVGELRLVEYAEQLAGVYLPRTPRPPEPPLDVAEARSPLLERTARQLGEYFAGTRRDFELPLAPRGSGFQDHVWRALLAIPFGETRSYGELARTIGRPAASRAVGAANAKNPISIIIPCHRVIAASGELTGYAGGMAAKRWLLDHEQRSSIARSPRAGDGARAS